MKDHRKYDISKQINHFNGYKLDIFYYKNLRFLKKMFDLHNQCSITKSEFLLDDSRQTFKFMEKKKRGQECKDINRYYTIIKANIYWFKKISCIQVFCKSHLYI